jgi:hypothetical protein
MFLYLMMKYAKKISCGRTKSEAIVTEVLAPASVREIINVLNLNMLEGYANTLPFNSVASDASNHSHTKLFPITLKYWTPKHVLCNNNYHM